MGFFASSGILNRRGFLGGAPVGIPPEFSPLSIPNLGLWLDANVGVTYDGSNLVSQWDDQSGNGRNFTQNVSNSRKPAFLSNQLNGKPVIDFYGSTGTANVLAGPDFMYDAGAASVFVVLQSNSPVSPLGTNAYLVAERSPAPATNYGIVAVRYPTPTTKLNAIIQYGTSPVLQFNTTTGYGTAYDQTWRIATMIDTGTSMSGYVDGVFGITESYSRGSGTSPTELLIGAGTSTASSYFNAKVAEIIIYSRALNNTEREQVENYLTSKWGI